MHTDCYHFKIHTKVKRTLTLTVNPNNIYFEKRGSKQEPVQ